ncbi:MAG TPA: DUF427 domain-containing protein [Pseudomonadales bacterium]|nr:DUF427 domain-containing protein [Pseudomonadales bacterium]
MRHPQPDPIAAGEESVWDYPRPPRLEPFDGHVRVVFAGRTVVDSRRALRLLETSHPPAYYVPAGDCDMDAFVAAPNRSFCEWKGQADYFDLLVGDRRAPAVAWTYPRPSAAYAALADHLSMYAAPMDCCQVDEHEVTPQPGRFYGGWITPGIRGPFKGIPGSEFW